MQKLSINLLKSVNYQGEGSKSKDRLNRNTSWDFLMSGCKNRERDSTPEFFRGTKTTFKVTTDEFGVKRAKSTIKLQVRPKFYRNTVHLPSLASKNKNIKPIKTHFQAA
jgi:hypothetical protein